MPPPRCSPPVTTSPRVDGILERVQIDHTVIDVIVVDERERQPVGRPYLSIGLDEASRCAVGMVVTLEPPSATSVGLCLAHMACDKQPWLQDLGVEGVSWPMVGTPRELFVDNAAEFHSEALRRGCEQHGIGLSYRPGGRPHYGGIIERIVGTVMQRVHELPGTTFSNPAERGGYDSDRQAALTLDELTRWLALAVASYHGTVQLHAAANPCRGVGGRRGAGRHPAGRRGPDGLPGGFPAGAPAADHPCRIRHRSCALLRQRPQTCRWSQ